MSASNESVPSAVGQAEPPPSGRPEKSHLELLQASSAEAGSGEQQRSLVAVLPTIAEAFFLFALIGASVGLALTLVQLPTEEFTDYIVKNTLARPRRHAVLLSMLVSAVVACLVPFGWLLFRRSWSVDKLLNLAWRFSPLMVAGFVPGLFHWKLWERREVEFLTLAAAVTWGVRRLTFTAASRPPVGFVEAVRRRFGGFRVFAHTERVRARVAAAMPTILAWAAAVGYAAYFAHHTIQTHHRLGTSAFDLGLEENLVWNLLHGGTPFKSSTLGGPTAVHFGYHATLFSYVLVPFYAIYQHAETLLLIQAILIGAAALPLYYFARRLVGAWSAAAIAWAYVLSPAVQGTNLYDFHYPPLGPFFLWLSLYALHAKRNVLAIIAIVLTLSVREDISAGVAVIGAYMLFWGGRPKAGLVTAAVGTVYFVLMKLVLMPSVLGQSESHLFIFKDLLPTGESSFGSVLKTTFGNPAFTWSTLVVQQKLIYILQIFVPLAFLPLRYPIGWVFSMPGILFTLLATRYDPPIRLGFQYAAHWVCFAFPALVVCLSYEQRPFHWMDKLGPARRLSWVVAILFGTLVVGYQFGIVFQKNIARAAWDEVRSGMSFAQEQKLKDLRAVIAKMPPRAKVVGSERVVPHLSNRPDAYRLLHSLYDAEYILVDRTGLGGEERARVIKALTDNQFGVLEIHGSFLLAKRGAPTDGNAEAIKKIK